MAKTEGVAGLLKSAALFVVRTYRDGLSFLRSPKGLKSLYGISLYRNAVYLMLNSGATAVLSTSLLVSRKVSAKIVTNLLF